MYDDTTAYVHWNSAINLSIWTNYYAAYLLELLCIRKPIFTL